MKKRLLAFLLVLVMVAGFVPVTARAEGEPAIIAQGTCGAQGDNVTWSLTEDGVLTVSGTGAMNDYKSSASSRPSWEEYKDKITAVVIGEGVTSIGNYSFYRNTSNKYGALKSVSIATTVKSIGNYAFRYTGLSEVSLPEGLTSLGTYSFANCDFLKTIYIPVSLTNLTSSTFTGCSFTTVTYSGSEFDWFALLEKGGNAPFADAQMTILGGSITAIELSGYKTEYYLHEWLDLSGMTATATLSTGEQGAIDPALLTHGDLDSSTPGEKTVTFSYKDVFTTITLTVKDEIGVMVSGICGVNDTGEIGDNLVFSLTSDGVLTISGTGEMFNQFAYNNVPWYSYNEHIRSVAIGEGVTSIGQNVFYGCTGLTSVVFPANIRSIGDWAFYNTGLINLELPATIQSVGVGVFQFCNQLKSVTVNCNLENMNVFQNCTALESAVVNGNITGERAFSGCSALKSVILPSVMTSIPAGMFTGCSALTAVELPDGIRTIGDNAFDNCAALTSVSFPAGLESIGYAAFRSSGLTHLELPVGVTMGSSAFAGCTDMTSATVGSVGSEMFSSCTALTTATLTDGVTSLPSGIFKGCTSLNTVYIPAGVLDYSLNAFDGIDPTPEFRGEGAEAATLFYGRITDENGVIYSGDYSMLISVPADFTGELTVHDGVRTLLDGAAQNVTGLTGVTLPTSLVNIGSNAFSGCTGLTEITIPELVKVLPTDAFNGCTSLTKIVLFEGLETLGSSAFDGCTNLAEIDLPSTLTNIEGRYNFRRCGSLKHIAIPEGVTKLPEQMFSQCTSLETIVLPSTLKTIDPLAIPSTALRTVYYRDSYSDFDAITWVLASDKKNVLKAAELVCYYGPTGDSSDAPVILEQPESKTFMLGDNSVNALQITVKAVGAEDRLYIDWFLNTDNSILGGTRIDHTSSEDGLTAWVTPSTAERGNLYYYCVVTRIAADNTFTRTTSNIARVSVINSDFEGTGTAEDPYLIQSAEDYDIIHAMVNESGNSLSGVYFKQTADITLPAGWTPLGRTKDGSNNIQHGANLLPFSAHLDGGGHTLTIPAGNMPLLGYVLGAEVKNLKIYGPQINGYGLVNNFEGVGLSGTAITIDNVTLVSGTQTLKSGLLGGNITTNGYAATSSGYKAVIRNCTVESGVIIGYNGDQSMIGSIAGRFQGSITNCTSAATVKGTNYVGGIVGTIDNTMAECAVSGCTFTGTVQASGDHAGGIMGGGYSNSTGPNGGKPVINNCSVSGTVTGANKVGGILGGDSFGFQSWGDYTISGNSFTGTVSGTGSAVGKIIGYYANLNKHDKIYNNTSDDGSVYGFVLSVDTSCIKYADDDTVPYGVDQVTGAYYYNSAVDDLATVDQQLVIPIVGASQYKFVSQRNHNRTDDPLGSGGEVTVVDLIVSGSYKTEYQMGEDFDQTGIVVTANYSDGTTADVTANAAFSGFDSTTAGQKTITVTFGGMDATFVVTVMAPAGETITVKLSVLGDTHHEMSEGSHGLWLGGLTEWVPETQYTISANAKVYDLITQADEADDTLTVESRFTQQYNSQYIFAVTKDGVRLEEKDDGRTNSGWMVAVNGVHVQVGVSNMDLHEGDTVILHWCDDYLMDEAAAAQQEEDKQAAFAVEALIDAIGTPITLDSENAITAARTAYDALNDNAKSYVDPDVYAVLTAAEAALAELKASAQRVADVIAAIDAIGEVTLDSADAISTARTAYNALTDDEKALVTNYATLTAAETALAELKASAQRVADVIAAINALPAADELTLNDETAVAAARAAYDALSDAEQAQVTNLAALEAAEAKIDQLEAEQDQQAASAADQVIAALPGLDAITLDDAAAVAEARAAYDALTPEQQALVNNYDALLAAEAKIAELQEQAASAQRVAEANAAIDALPAADEVTLADEATVIAARMAYDALSDAEKAQVSADKLIAAEAKIAELKAQQSSQEKITDATDKINAIPAADAVTLADEAAIAAARAAYDALTDAEKAQVDASALVAAEARLAALKFAALKPEVKTANAKNGKIELTITPVAGAVKYKIYVSEKADGTYKEAATVTEPKYTYNGTPGTRYFFKVVAVNAEGVESAESAVVSQFRLPAQVTSLKVKSKKKKEVTLTWKKVTGAKKYVIYMSKNGKTGWKKIGTVKTNKFTYKKAPAGKKMYFRVQAVTANGKKGEFSKAVSVKVKK